MNGDFKLSDTVQMDSIPLIATDIDGVNNGVYKTDTIYVDFKNAEHIGGGDGWFQGELVATANFKLEAQDTNE
jgi:putative lipoprotein (rSAM/lipoprotein system)